MASRQEQIPSRERESTILMTGELPPYLPSYLFRAFVIRILDWRPILEVASSLSSARDGYRIAPQRSCHVDIGGDGARIVGGETQLNAWITGDIQFIVDRA